MRPMLRIRVCVRALLSIASLGIAATSAAQAPSLEGLNEFVEREMSAWGVPGVAIAIVHEDSVLLARGYGAREVGRRDRVNEHTLFGIMSTTKAFTSAAVAMLVDEGKVNWEDPVTRHLPGFQLPSPWATQEFTVRDLLSHRVGLERGDFLWFGSGYDRRELVHHLRYMEEVASFRAEYGYSNNMYITAGRLVAAVSGTTWDEFIDQRIFEPLGMVASNTSVVDLHDAGNVAIPHETIDGRVQAIAYRSLDNEAPGGSINSSAHEMAQWLRLQLGEGTYQGNRLVSEDALRVTRTPQTIIPFGESARETNPGLHFLFYAMGWTVQDYRGSRLVQHSGGIDGLRSRIALLPEEDFGFVVLTNKGSGNALPDVIRNWILDAFLDVDPPEWGDVFRENFQSQQAAADSAEAALIASRLTGTSPSLDLGRYTGHYENAAYGQADVRLEDGSLVVQLGPSITGDLEHWHFDTFKAVWRNPYLGWSLVTFELDPEGRVCAMNNTNWWPDYTRVVESPSDR